MDTGLPGVRPLATTPEPCKTTHARGIHVEAYVFDGPSMENKQALIWRFKERSNTRYLIDMTLYSVLYKDNLHFYTRRAAVRSMAYTTTEHIQEHS